MQRDDFDFQDEMVTMASGMDDHAHAEGLISLIEWRIQGFWDPIPISPDTVEVETEVASDDEEVNWPASKFGVSMSGNFGYDLGEVRLAFDGKMFSLYVEFMAEYGLLCLDSVWACLAIFVCIGTGRCWLRIPATTRLYV